MIAPFLFALMTPQTPSAGAGEHRPPEAHSAAPHAVDHVAVVEAVRGSGPPGVDRHSVKRSGSWLREDRDTPGGTLVTFSDFESATSISQHVDGDGTVRSLMVERHPSSDTYNLWRRSRTGARERALGESCDVWRTTPAGEAPGEGVAWLTCVTRDGIELWSRTVSERTGTILSSSRILSFQRRRLSAREVQPPRDLLGWRRWGQAGDSSGPGPVGAADNYTVRFEGQAAALGKAWRIERRRGAWSSVEMGNKDGALLASLDGAGMVGSYHAETGGRPVRLSLALKGRNPRSVRPTYAPIEPRQAERVAGEECLWSEHGGENGIVIVSGTHRTCVSADGIPLRIYSRHRALIADFKATSIDRSPPRSSRFSLPDRASDWSAWGIRLDR